MTNNLTINKQAVFYPRNFIRDKILSIEEEMKKVPSAYLGDSDLCPLKHSFSEGIYVREIFIPAGTLVVGKIHKHSHPNFLMQGKVSVLTEMGIRHLEAPLSMVSPAGTKRVVYAHTDTVWITVHKTNKINLKKIEKEIIAKDYDEFDLRKINFEESEFIAFTEEAKNV